jgi:hypothetical protein
MCKCYCAILAFDLTLIGNILLKLRVWNLFHYFQCYSSFKILDVICYENNIPGEARVFPFVMYA